MNDSMMDDAFEGLLGGNGADPPPALRERLRQTTLGYVRQRRRVRRLGQACAAAAVLLAVGLAWYSVFGTPAEETQQVVVAPESSPVAPAVVVTDPAAVSASELEWQAFDSAGKERLRRYFEAGNLYLEVEADYTAALRCYSQALADASPRELEFAPNDSWLLLTLKNARRQGVN